jgi:hypothetical protein
MGLNRAAKDQWVELLPLSFELNVRFRYKVALENTAAPKILAFFHPRYRKIYRSIMVQSQPREIVPRKTLHKNRADISLNLTS